MSKFRRILTYILDLGVNPKRQPLDEEDLKLAAYLIDLGESIDKGDFDIEMEQHLSNFEDDLQDLSWTPEDDECHKIQMYPDVVHLPGNPNMIQFANGEFVELDKVKEAVVYFGSKTGLKNNGSKVRPSLEQVHTKFRFIRNRNHMDKLREYETLGSTKANRKSNLEFISMELEKETLTNYAQLTNSNYKFQTRDETLKLLSLVWRQLCSPKLEKWARYAWVAAGYDVPRPASFETPAQLLFPRGVAGDCTMHGCSSTSFVKCLYCEKLFCFEHFVIDHHNC
ncbi:hypothetical protein L5515_009378 [Caenorhabditis briggsae]|uniref:Transposase Tc5 C-terminal domain-containing protein n=1 Tax=Caenorhabditis briggsae TaxID=6238 RepID=A0AAE9JPY2_CAEBR|nr:hypothetical protein L5515_009378 [Caenorhabditis briggsae]